MTHGPEYHEVEFPLIEQLTRMGWTHLQGDKDVPAFTERESFKEALLLGRLQEAVERINRPKYAWLESTHVSEAVSQLTRLPVGGLLETNALVTDMLLSGVQVTGPDGKGHTVRFIDFGHPDRNDLLVINQFRVDPPGYAGGKGYIIPDVVLFVNGIPIAVVECKSPNVRDGLELAVEQLRLYQDLRGSAEPEGVQRFFHTVQLLVATSFYKAVLGTAGAEADQFLEWKDTFPLTSDQVRTELGGKPQLHAQQQLVAGILRPSTMLNLLENFILTDAKKKIVARYQQYRAVRKALVRLEAGETRLLGAEVDGRGGIVWHTQGSGKSLTMVFLVRALRTMPELRAFKIVVITDRRDLEGQLSRTARATGEPVTRAKNVKELQDALRQQGAGFVFGMVQKFRLSEDDEGQLDLGNAVLNDSASILVLVDEAHRSHTSTQHANLRAALPNAALIGFTGTPIVQAAKKKTHEIFGPFIDTYTILESQQDRATVPIRYEGRVTKAALKDGQTMDGLFEDFFDELSSSEKQRLQAKYGTLGDILEAPKLIGLKASDMLLHYASSILPGGFKGQVVAASRLAAVRYEEAFREAQRELVRDLEQLDSVFLSMPPEKLGKLDARTRALVAAHPQLEKLRATQFAVVISGGQHDDQSWAKWTDTAAQNTHIENFKNESHPLRLLIVKNMLLTGFDAPIEQVLYLDRNIRNHELLQAIARVNRTAPGKTYGLVVDYFGVGQHLAQALAAYTATDIQGAITSVKDTLPVLEAAHQAVKALLINRNVELTDREACVNVLADVKLRSEFKVKLSAFLSSLDAVLPRPEGLPYVADASRLSQIEETARSVYQDTHPVLLGAGAKVRALIAQYVEAHGVSIKVPSVEVLDPNFGKEVKTYTSKRTQAASMEHAARHHIRTRFDEDPVYYRSLSEKLEQLISQYHESWEALAEALEAFIREIQAGRPVDTSGLDPKSQAPFYSLLLEAQEHPADPERQQELARMTVHMVTTLTQRISMTDFWRNPVMRDATRGWLITYLDDRNLVPFDKCDTTADELMHLARHLHSRLMDASGPSSATT
ncbi:type I restriction endonuclease subunit R [Deinococcus peraridilitoris]|uniref:Type I restriction enzyme endonuclease subunit n=1 Tax=Deinococcus peraridilitoris (strain DSM 19664 / LMG 22246 / CIP 109416 / KR-200) TaxID=937777 RepID=L0A0P9_DEIPD|nr:type I restriction endonuclease subunit R [Deinococcus peraridilitoris]AFZ67421.1 type I site-specific deoxyribonuclease, HsdR family [Deinococcus peraridilitoris DSM 19664]